MQMKRTTISLDEGTFKNVFDIAIEEERSMTKMISILIKKGIIAYKEEKQRKEPIVI